jgi:hypothetical protein
VPENSHWYAEYIVREQAGKELDPEFAAKAADVVGLYKAPPENAIVVSRASSAARGSLR